MSEEKAPTGADHAASATPAVPRPESADESNIAASPVDAERAGASVGTGSPVEAVIAEGGPAARAEAETAGAGTGAAEAETAKAEAADAEAAESAPAAAEASTADADADADAAGAGAAAAPAAPSIPELPPAQCAARLAELFPALFTPGSAKPLKLRIQADIQQRAPGIFTRKSLSIFLHRHTTSTAYLKALMGAPSRIDLDGAAAGEVAEEHREAARTELERRRAIFDARRAAERQAQRAAHRGPQGEGRPVPPAAATAEAPHEAVAEAGHARGPAGQRDGRGEGRGEGRGADRRGGPRGASHDGGPPGQARRGNDREGQAGRQGSPAQGGRQRPSEVRPRPERHRDVRPPRHESEDRAVHEGRTGHPVPRIEPLFDDPVRRERAALLRAYESTTLTRSNFCALKGMKEADLETVLAQARQDAAERQLPRPAPAAPAPTARPARTEKGTGEPEARPATGKSAGGRPPPAPKHDR